MPKTKDKAIDRLVTTWGRMNELSPRDDIWIVRGCSQMRGCKIKIVEGE